METDKPLITTIIPTYRRPKLLNRAINSVLKQTFTKFQVCVYDNASGDQTASVVKDYISIDGRVRYFCHEENIGAAKNFNFALKKIDTPFFSFLSDDDLLVPDFYSIAMAEYRKHPEALFVSTGILGVNRYNDIVPESHVYSLKPGVYMPPGSIFQIVEPNPPTWTGILFKKEVLDKIGFIDESTGTVFDMDFILRAALSGPFVYTSTPGAIFIVGSISTPIASMRGSINSFWPGWLNMINKLAVHEAIPDERKNELLKILDKQLERRLWTIGLAAIVRGDFSDSYRTAEIMAQRCDLHRKARLLRAVVKYCQDSALMYGAVKFLNEIRFKLSRVGQMRRGLKYLAYKTILSAYE